MAHLTLYTRSGCHLCEEARAVLDEVRRTVPFELLVVDIDADPSLRRRFNEEIPLVEIDGRRVFQYRFHAQDVIRKLLSLT